VDARISFLRIGALVFMSSIQVVFADNQPLTLSGLRCAVAEHADIEVLAECLSRERLMQAVREHAPHVLLVSAELLQQELDSIEHLRAVAEDTRVILLTARKDPEFMDEALRCGAHGILDRERPLHYIPIAIRKVTSGGLWFARDVADRMLEELLENRSKAPDDDARRIATITAREREVIGLICEGLRNKEISDRLHISEATVSHHLTAIFRKLEVDDRISLVIFAVRKRLVVLQE
jgi:DNA-binding NarL/FixJ family response regulator